MTFASKSSIGPSYAAHGPYIQCTLNLLTESYQEQENEACTNLKKPPPLNYGRGLNTEMLWEKFNSHSYSHKRTHYYFVNQTIANYQAQKALAESAYTSV